jgi:putative FmdB family regulatory protein
LGRGWTKGHSVHPPLNLLPTRGGEKFLRELFIIFFQSANVLRMLEYWEKTRDKKARVSPVSVIPARDGLTKKHGEEPMPIYEYRCEKCGQVNEFLVLGRQEQLQCKECGGEALTKVLSAHNVSIGSPKGPSEPVPGGCCGKPNSCGSPGSCCSG